MGWGIIGAMEPQEPQPILSDIIIEAMKAKGLNLIRLSELTDVPENSLSLIIEEKFEKLPPAPYVHGYIIRIAQILNLDGERLWAEYLKGRSELKRPGSNDVLPQNRFHYGKFRKKTLIIAGAVIVVFGYIIIRLPGLLGTPSFSLDNIPATVTAPDLVVQGRMNPADQLLLNGQAIYPDKSGRFTETLTLQPGFNTLVFDIRKLIGQEYTVTKQVYYNAPSSTGSNAAPPAAPTSTNQINSTSTKK